jgi:adenosylmethionine---8-amino-7-oxononanoate aminotransferase
VLARSVDAHSRELGRVLLFVLMDEHFEDVGRGQELGQHDPLRSLVGAYLVDGCFAGHPERHHDEAGVLFDETLACDAQVLEPGYRTPNDLEGLAMARAVGQFGEGFGSHVKAGEHGVDHTDSIHAGSLSAHFGSTDLSSCTRLSLMTRNLITGGGLSDSVSSGAEWVARDAAVVWHGFTQMSSYSTNSPVMVDRGEGREVIDVDGQRYFDAISSLWVTTLGHHVPELDEALVDQLGRVAHTTLLGNGSRSAVEFAEALAEVVPVDDAHVLFASDGAVAVEQALKIAFQYWVNRGITGRVGFLALGDAYHGDTVGALSLGDGGFGTALFDPLRFPVARTPGYAVSDWATKAIAVIEARADEFAAMVIEPLVQGASGILVAEPIDLARVGEACRSHGVLLICDEVATGFGRTGKLFASEWAGLGFRPDIMCLGKGITGGYLPLSATVASGAVFDAFDGADLGERAFYHGHSYGGNALACAVALRHLRLIDEWDVLANVITVGKHLAGLLADRVEGHPGVGAVRQRGLMVGIELSPPAGSMRWGRRVCAGAVGRGVLLRPLGDVIVLMPPLTSTAEEMERVVEVLTASLDAVWNEDTGGSR